MEWLMPDEELLLLDDATDASRPDLEGQFRLIHALEAQWQLAATPDQRAIAEGDFYTMPIDLLPDGGRVQAYGRIMGSGQLATREKVHGADYREVEALLARLDWGASRGWRYVEAFSAGVPEGEYGFIHVARMSRISQADFETARAARWPR